MNSPSMQTRRFSQIWQSRLLAHAAVPGYYEDSYAGNIKKIRERDDYANCEIDTVYAYTCFDGGSGRV